MTEQDLTELDNLLAEIPASMALHQNGLRHDPTMESANPANALSQGAQDQLADTKFDLDTLTF